MSKEVKDTTVIRNENNNVRLQGYVAKTGLDDNGKPVFNHEVFGEKFYQFHLEVARQSDTDDVLPITVSERLVDIDSIQEGDYVEVVGQVRTYNKVTEGGKKLLISVFAQEITINGEHSVNANKDNSVELMGFICKEPVYRKTPLGREICDLLLAVNRPYGKSDYIPCICWGRNARFAASLAISTQLEVKGRLQSREYIKKLDEDNTEKRVAYELSVSKLDVVGEEV